MLILSSASDKGFGQRILINFLLKTACRGNSSESFSKKYVHEPVHFTKMTNVPENTKFILKKQNGANRIDF
jgi:hypothetical protein